MPGVLVRRVAVAAACGGLALGPVAPAEADHGGGGPSAAAVAAGKARVARLERQVSAAADAVNRAESALDGLRTQAEVAIESFDRARVAESQAAQAVVAAQVVVAAADDRVRAARGQLSRFAVAAYEGGGLSSLDAVLTSDGPAAMLYRLTALDAVARSQRDVLQVFRAATVYDGVVRAQASERLQQAHAATAAADAARQKAQTSVATQVQGVATLTTARQRLATMLTDARAHAGALEQARLAALARERAAAAEARRAAAARAARQRAEQQQPVGPVTVGGGGGGSGGGSGGGGSTVSSATEQGAVRAAESQIGKPYQWGAAGPDSYDCSGLVMWAYAQVGVQVDHWTGDQWNEGEHIPLSSLRPGDLLFFATDTSNPDTIHHVGMYIGNAQMVEAPYTGADVRISDAFRPDLIGAVRFYNR